MLAKDLSTALSERSVPIMESNRSCLRRARDEAEFSNQSIFSSMEKFVNAVQDMDETILVPCRLMDLKVGDATDSVPSPPEPKIQFKPGMKATRRVEGFRDTMASADLYNLYTLVNTVKNELQWGMREHCPVDEGIDSPTITPVSSTTHIKGHQRRPSNVSVSSTNSSSISDADSDTGNENDSGFDGEASPKPECTQQVAQNFRRHLHGLYRSLEQMTEAATYLTARYQKDVGDAV
ncbi:mid1-interacting protein 1-B [Frankliniella occidentalis]|uniref:Mid1-interacting protein 1-B n=1 Tax=Frankliniella occidentalis TaxID=133901 RepID=A0A6J1SN28_FRAOC|nr:mid1-interacting protein 1-B [Frankliniella occidentalis]